MTSKRNSILILLILLLPTCGLLAAAGYSYQAIQKQPSVVLPITGYDPRDLIRGHYLLFQINWPWRAKDPVTCTTGPADCRLCLNTFDATQPNVIQVALVAAQDTAQSGQCQAVIGSITHYSAPDTRTSGTVTAPTVLLKNTPGRFYVDEHDGPWLDAYFRKHPDDFSVAVKIHNGTIHLQELLIDGRPYRITMLQKPALAD